MFELLKKRIESKAYKLEKTLDLIDEMRVKEKITKEEADKLYEFARTNAVAENSYNIQKQLDNIFTRLEALENKDKIEEPTEQEEYPAFVQPTGSHDSYKIDDKIIYNGKKYICKMDNCVWGPAVYPDAWEEVIEEAEQETTEEKVEMEE